MVLGNNRLPLAEGFFQPPPLNECGRERMIQVAKQACKEVVFYARQVGGPLEWIPVTSEKQVEICHGKDRRGAMGNMLPPLLEAQSNSTTNIKYVRGFTPLYASLEEIASFFRLDSPVKRKAFQQVFATDMLDEQVLYELVAPTFDNPKHSIDVKWTAMASPNKLARNRDFVYLECQDEFVDTIHNKRGWVRSMHSIRLACAPELAKSHHLVRGGIYRSGMVFLETDDPNCVHALYLLHMDVKGSAPDWIKTMAVHKRLVLLSTLNEYFLSQRLSKRSLYGPSRGRKNSGTHPDDKLRVNSTRQARTSTLSTSSTGSPPSPRHAPGKKAPMQRKAPAEESARAPAPENQDNQRDSRERESNPFFWRRARAKSKESSSAFCQHCTKSLSLLRRRWRCAKCKRIMCSNCCVVFNVALCPTHDSTSNSNNKKANKCRVCVSCVEWAKHVIREQSRRGNKSNASTSAQALAPNATKSNQDHGITPFSGPLLEEDPSSLLASDLSAMFVSHETYATGDVDSFSPSTPAQNDLAALLLGPDRLVVNEQNRASGTLPRRPPPPPPPPYPPMIPVGPSPFATSPYTPLVMTSRSHQPTQHEAHHGFRNRSLDDQLVASSMRASTPFSAANRTSLMNDPGIRESDLYRLEAALAAESESFYTSSEDEYPEYPEDNPYFADTIRMGSDRGGRRLDVELFRGGTFMIPADEAGRETPIETFGSTQPRYFGGRRTLDSDEDRMLPHSRTSSASDTAKPNQADSMYGTKGSPLCPSDLFVPDPRGSMRSIDSVGSSIRKMEYDVDTDRLHRLRQQQLSINNAACREHGGRSSDLSGLAERMALSAMRLYDKEMGSRARVSHETRQAALNRMVELYTNELRDSQVEFETQRSSSVFDELSSPSLASRPSAVAAASMEEDDLVDEPPFSVLSMRDLCSMRSESEQSCSSLDTSSSLDDSDLACANPLRLSGLSAALDDDADEDDEPDREDVASASLDFLSKPAVPRPTLFTPLRSSSSSYVSSYSQPDTATKRISLLPDDVMQQHRLSHRFPSFSSRKSEGVVLLEPELMRRFSNATVTTTTPSQG